MPSTTFGLQMCVDNMWASQGGAKIGGKAWGVFTFISHLESPSETLKEVGGEFLLGVTYEEGS